jgi:predicted nucleotidyltransferase
MVNLINIQRILQQLKPGLSKKYSVSSIGLFGSVVRDDFHTVSDVDILVDFSTPIGIEFISLADELEEKLNCKVDLVSRAGIKEKYFKEIESQIVYV